MGNYDGAMQYINSQEATDISYVKVGENAPALVVSFASNRPPHKDFFQRKTSLLELKYKYNHDFDVLYLRNNQKWYLGGLNGVGKNIQHTLAFLKREFIKYDTVKSIGQSSGGYASILFGSLLNIESVVAINPQIDLDYIIENRNYPHLVRRKKETPSTWVRYNNLANVLNDKVDYQVYFKGDENCTENDDDIFLHGEYHYNLIKDFSTITRLETHDIPPDFTQKK